MSILFQPTGATPEGPLGPPSGPRNSVPVLLAIYARCIVGQQDGYLKRIAGVQYSSGAAVGERPRTPEMVL